MAHEGALIELAGLTKRFGAVTAVDGLDVRIRPGRVTGFLGPNGAGKTTTFRLLLGLARPTSGTATIGGHDYRGLRRPPTVIGAALGTAPFHPGRTGRDNLRVAAGYLGVPDARVDDLLGLVGLGGAGRRRVAGYSMGMRQRLELATALLGDPAALVLDEPANGLDPEGIAWLRGFLRRLAAEGRTVLVSSHLLGEVQQTVDDVVVIAHGRLVQASTLAELEARAAPAARVRTPSAAALLAELARRGMRAETRPDGTILVPRHSPAEVGAAAFAAGVEVHELAQAGETVEQTFLRLVGVGPVASPGEPA